MPSLPHTCLLEKMLLNDASRVVDEKFVTLTRWSGLLSMNALQRF